MNQRAFGRKASAQTASPFLAAPERRTAPVMPGADAHLAEERRAPAPAPEANLEAQREPNKSVDDEIAEWKQSRRFAMPWRQMSLMATLCFGLASLVLPDSVDEPGEWLLYALTAASMISTVAAWWKKLTHVV